MPVRPLVACALAFALAASALAAHANERPAPRTSSLSWIRLPGADSCISTQDLAREVEAKLGRPVFVSPSRADVSVEGRIEATKEGWKATLVLRNTRGETLGTRELARPGPSCDAMREPVVLVVAVMIDPDATLAPAPAPATSTSTSTSTSTGAGAGAGGEAPLAPTSTSPAAMPQAESPSTSAAARSSELELEVGAAGVGAVGLLPSAGVGVQVDAILRPPELLSGRVMGAVYANQTVSTPGTGTATFSLMVAGAGVCPFRSRTARGSMSLCVEAHVGQLSARGEGFDEPRSASDQLHVAGAVGARMSRLVLGPLALRFGVTGVVPFIRDSFAYRERTGFQSELFRMSPVAGTLDLGVGVLLP